MVVGKEYKGGDRSEGVKWSIKVVTVVKGLSGV